MSIKPLVRLAIHSFPFLVFFLVISLLVVNYDKSFKEIFSPASLIDAGDSSNIQNPPTRDWSVGELQVAANAAICVESSSSGDKVLFKTGNNSFPIASLTKLMTALIILENKDKNEDYNLDKVTVISQEAASQPPSLCYLAVGDYLSVENLLHIMLIDSSNEAAFSLAEITGIEQFVALMNEKAADLGLSSTNFADVTGVSPENRSSTDDLVKLAKYIIYNYPEIFEISSKDNYWIYNPSGQRYCLLSNTNKLLASVPNIIGGKTGETVEAKGCLLLVLKNPTNQNNMIYVILGSDDRFKEMEKLINWVSQAYKW